MPSFVRSVRVCLVRFIFITMILVSRLIRYAGATWEARNIYDMSGHTVALKIQDRDIEYPTNCRERAIYPLLQGGIGMPRLWTAGVQGKYDYLAIDLLGNSLDKIYRENGKATMDMRTVCSIAVQLVSLLGVILPTFHLRYMSIPILSVLRHVLLG